MSEHERMVAELVAEQHNGSRLAQLVRERDEAIAAAAEATERWQRLRTLYQAALDRNRQLANRGSNRGD